MNVEFRLAGDRLACRNAGALIVEACLERAESDARRARERLVKSAELARQDRDECLQRCKQRALECDDDFKPEISPEDFHVVIDFERPFQLVPEICQYMVDCPGCVYSLCRGGEMTFESEPVLDVTLVAATDPVKDARVIAKSSNNGKQAVLTFPNDIKLNENEQLYLSFGSSQKLSAPVNVKVIKNK